MNFPRPNLTATKASSCGEGTTPNHIGFCRAVGPFIPVQTFSPVVPSTHENSKGMSVFEARGILAMVANHDDCEILRACQTIMFAGKTSKREKRDADMIARLLLQGEERSLDSADDPGTPVISDVNLGDLIYG